MLGGLHMAWGSRCQSSDSDCDDFPVETSAGSFCTKSDECGEADGRFGEHQGRVGEAGRWHRGATVQKLPACIMKLQSQLPRKVVRALYGFSSSRDKLAFVRETQSGCSAGGGWMRLWSSWACSIVEIQNKSCTIRSRVYISRVNRFEVRV
ncbi:hypothetical protein C8R47DRAFT_692140 [Mycena vitilis]|nr:hypothetical protein C8R47DRAFT_692140 [Mycena vitilis]